MKNYIVGITISVAVGVILFFAINFLFVKINKYEANKIKTMTESIVSETPVSYGRAVSFKHDSHLFIGYRETLVHHPDCECKNK